MASSGRERWSGVHLGINGIRQAEILTSRSLCRIQDRTLRTPLLSKSMMGIQTLSSTYYTTSVCERYDISFEGQGVKNVGTKETIFAIEERAKKSLCPGITVRKDLVDSYQRM
jgi:hypothetical protein